MIAIPHVALGVAFFYLFVFVIRIQLDTITQLVGHVTVVTRALIHRQAR